MSNGAMPLDIIGQADQKRRTHIRVLVDQETRNINLFQSVSNGKVIRHKNGQTDEESPPDNPRRTIEVLTLIFGIRASDIYRPFH
jgi:hypothetical protein